MSEYFFAEIDKIILAILDSPLTYVILGLAVWLSPRFFDKFFSRQPAPKKTPS